MHTHGHKDHFVTDAHLAHLEAHAVALLASTRNLMRIRSSNGKYDHCEQAAEVMLLADAQGMLQGICDMGEHAEGVKAAA